MVTALEDLFPGLRGSGYRLTSPATANYNCVAWAVGDMGRWWWPDPDADDETSYWPPGITREETVEAFAAALQTAGFERCADSASEEGYEKVAVFGSDDGLPTHAARQLPNGNWTSKLGRLADIEHPLEALEGQEYGQVMAVFRRAIQP